MLRNTSPSHLLPANTTPLKRSLSPESSSSNDSIHSSSQVQHTGQIPRTQVCLTQPAADHLPISTLSVSLENLSLNDATKTARHLANLRAPWKNNTSSSSVAETQKKTPLTPALSELASLKPDRLSKKDILNILEQYQLYIKTEKHTAAEECIQGLIRLNDLSGEVKNHLIHLQQHINRNFCQIYLLETATDRIKLFTETWQFISEVSQWIKEYKGHLYEEGEVDSQPPFIPDNPLSPPITMSPPRAGLSKSQAKKQEKIVLWAHYKIQENIDKYTKIFDSKNTPMLMRTLESETFQRAQENIHNINDIFFQLKEILILGKIFDPNKIIPQINQLHSEVIHTSQKIQAEFKKEKLADTSKIEELIQLRRTQINQLIQYLEGEMSPKTLPTELYGT